MTNQEISFRSNNLMLAGTMYVPEIRAAPCPALVVGHPASGVKEQAAGLYARLLAEHGFVTIAFDAAHQGASEGEPRGLEDPRQRIEDLRSALSFLATRPEADPRRMGLLAVCASAGYAAEVAATDVRVRAFATVSGADIGRQFREGPDGRQDPAVLRGLLEAAAAARTAEARGEPAATFPIFPPTEADARRGGAHVFEGWEYYCTPRAAHPRSAKAFSWSSVDRIAAFEGFRFMDRIAPRPLLMVVGRNAITAHMTTEAFTRAHQPKQLVWIEGASHVDLYDRRAPEVTEHLAAFFTETLRPA